MEYKVLCVDIDNTLINYTYTHNYALNKVLKSFNCTLEDYQKAKNEIKSRGLIVNHHKKELYFKTICENKRLSILTSFDMYNMYKKEFLANIKVDKTMFEYVKNFNGTVVVLTNYYLLQQIEKLKTTGILKYIDYIITSEEFECEKPNQKLLNKVKQLTKCENKDILMIGDAETDIFDDVDCLPYNCSKLFISISGKSGAGKSTISKAIKNAINADIIECDGYHKYSRNDPAWERLTHYNPEANNLVQLAMDVQKLYYDYTAVIPIYNHSTGEFDNPIKINSDVLILEGLHTLYPEVTGDFIKIKIFIDSDVSDAQKITRDTSKRNKTKDSVLKSINNRKEDEIYINSQKEYSNFLIEVKDGKYYITTKNLGLSNYSGDYSTLIDDLKDIFIKYINDRYV